MLEKAIVLFSLALFLAGAAAIGQPQAEMPFADTILDTGAFAVAPPEPPLTGECHDIWATSNVRCSGDIRLYELCSPTLVEGIGEWQPRSENCKAYGSEWTCFSNDCVQFSDKPIAEQFATFLAVGVGAAVAFAIYTVFVKKKGRKRK